MAAEFLWIPITLLAAALQVARTAMQKRLKKDLSDAAASWTRFGYAAPVAVAYFFAAGLVFDGGGDSISLPSAAAFYFWCALAGAAQIVATIMLIALFSHRRFANGTALSKTESLQIAALGALFFGEELSAAGYIGVVIGAAGALLLSTADGGRIIGRAAALGLGSGLLFAITALGLRKALAVSGMESPFLSAAAALPVMVLWQAFALGVWLAWRERHAFQKMLRLGAWPWAVGVTSALGSAAWFTAFAMAHPALVKTLAQVELPLALLCGWLFFGEKCAPREIAGMAAVGAAAAVVAWAA